MKTLKILVVICLIVIDCSRDVQAQQLFTPFAFSSTQGNLRLSVSQGEPFVGQLTGNTFLATMGFHQGKADLMSSVAEDRENYAFSVMPNPTQSFVIFQSERPFKKIIIYDSEGKQVVQLETGTTHRYELQLSLVPGFYFSRVIFDNGHAFFQKLVII